MLFKVCVILKIVNGCVNFFILFYYFIELISIGVKIVCNSFKVLRFFVECVVVIFFNNRCVFNFM